MKRKASRWVDWVNWLTFRLLIIIMVGAWVWVFLQRQPEEPEYRINNYDQKLIDKGLWESARKPTYKL